MISVRAAGVGNWDEIVRVGDWDIGHRPPPALGVENVDAVGEDVATLSSRPWPASSARQTPCGWIAVHETLIPANIAVRVGLESRYPSSADRGFKSFLSAQRSGATHRGAPLRACGGLSDLTVSPPKSAHVPRNPPTRVLTGAQATAHRRTRKSPRGSHPRGPEMVRRGGGLESVRGLRRLPVAGLAVWASPASASACR